MTQGADLGRTSDRRIVAGSSDALLGPLAILMAAALWGTTGTAATFAPAVSPFAIGAAAMGIGGLLQAAIAWKAIARARAALAHDWLHLAVGAVAVAAYPLPFYAAMRLAGVTIGTVITIGSAPLFAAFIEAMLDGTRLSLRWMSGAALGIVGMVLISFAKTAGPAAAAPAPTLGVALGLLAGFAYALYSWAARRLMNRGIPSMAAMGATFGIGGLLLMPVLVATGGAFLQSWQNALVGLYMASVPMGLGYLCFGYGLARIAASTATTLTLFEPAVAAALAVLVVGERLTLIGWVGVALVILCLVVVTLPMRPIRSAPARLPGS